MTEQQQQYPTREQIAEAILPVMASEWDRTGAPSPYRIADAVLALFRQSHQTADEHCTGGDDCPSPIHVHGCFSDTGTCTVPDEHPEPVSIADMAPGTTFDAALTSPDPVERWMRVNSCHPVARMRDGWHAAVEDLDPSTIRDVTPPPV